MLSSSPSIGGNSGTPLVNSSSECPFTGNGPDIIGSENRTTSVVGTAACAGGAGCVGVNAWVGATGCGGGTTDWDGESRSAVSSACVAGCSGPLIAQPSIDLRWFWPNSL